MYVLVAVVLLSWLVVWNGDKQTRSSSLTCADNDYLNLCLFFLCEFTDRNQGEQSPESPAFLLKGMMTSGNIGEERRVSLSKTL
jgi:hypothetical protein